MPTSPELASLQPMQYNAIVGLRPDHSVFTPADAVLDVLVRSFLGWNVSLDLVLDPVSALHDQHDTVVPADSQRGPRLFPAGSPDLKVVSGVVHSAMSPVEIGETASRAAWNHAFAWLTGQAPSPAAIAVEAGREKLALADPLLDLTGYTSVSASNASFSPPANASIGIGVATQIAVSSATKTVTQLLLFQVSADAADIPLLFATAAPFSVSFTPARLGTASFVAITLFSDMTYASTLLSYTLLPAGQPASLNLIGVPAAIGPGMTVLFSASAAYPAGTLDVTTHSSFAARGGGVFSVGATGTITALAPGSDWLDATYAGLTASAQISVRAPLQRVLDVDGNTAYDALTDGLLLIRYLFGVTGPALISGAVGSGATVSDPAALVSALAALRPRLDIDGNGRTDALTDGLLIIRYLFGLRGSSLIAGAVDPRGSRTTASEIETYIQSLMP